MKVIKLIPLFLFALSISLNVSAQTKDDPDNHLALGADMPEFEYVTADGKTLKSEDLWGKDGWFYFLKDTGEVNLMCSRSKSKSFWRINAFF